MFIKSLNLNMKLCSVRLGVSLLLLAFGLAIFLYLESSGGGLVIGAGFTCIFLWDWSAPDVKGFRSALHRQPVRG